MSIVYRTENLVDGKWYIGVHSLNQDDYLGSGRYLKNAVRKHGKQNFKRETLFEGDDEICYFIESHLVTQKEVDNDNCYNQTLGGGHPPSHKGVKRSQESIDKSVAKRMGRKRSPESRLRMRNAHLGKKLQEEQKKKISQAMLGNKYNLGKKASPETLMKKSVALKGRPQRPEDVAKRRASLMKTLERKRLCQADG